MNRYTKMIKDTFIIDLKDINSDADGYIGDPINKLAEFENIVDEILLKQDELSKELEVLRSKGETKSYKFRELLGRKLINSAIIAILESHKLIKK